jgi:allantoate deiminase
MANREIEPQDLQKLLESLGAMTDATPGVTRLAYGPAWCDGHRLLATTARDLGLAATSDPAGNLYFHAPDVRPHAGRDALMIGSHLDSVVHGGAYDGAYGAVSGLLVAASLAGKTSLPVVGFATCEEDEVRFGNRMMGARSMLGLAESSELESVHDGAGISWGDALKDAEALGCATPRVTGAHVVTPLFTPKRMLELHIEQGPVLEAAHESIGIVDRIAGFRRLRVRVTGEARHAGTTPAAARHDALAAAAEMVLAAEALAKDSDEASRVTAGNVRVDPGNYNVVPGACELWLEVRHVMPSSLDALADEMDKRCRAVGNRRGVRVLIDRPSEQPPTTLSSELADQAAALARRLKIAHRRMTSGAGHDAMVFAQQGVPTLMIFVPSRGGISHAPEEFTSPEALWDGFKFTRDLAAQLAGDAA